MNIRHKLIRPYTPRHNSKAERSRREDQKRFYVSHSFFLSLISRHSLNCEIYNNNISNCTNGVHLWRTDGCSIYNNTVGNDKLSDQKGIYFNEAYGGWVCGNQVSGTNAAIHFWSYPVSSRIGGHFMGSSENRIGMSKTGEKAGNILKNS